MHRPRATVGSGDAARSGPPLGRIRAGRLPAVAVCSCAVLATLGLAGTDAAANSGGGSFLSFLESLFGLEPRSEPRRSRRRERPPPAMRRPPPQEAVPAPPLPSDPPEAVATYRTMCVRLCDGYYWPVSFATAKDSFGRDEQACLDSCSASAALYYYSNPGGALDEMVSLAGEPYKGLATAFLYRTVYDPRCKCRPHPWEAAAIERHKSYASRGQTRALVHGSRSRR